MTAFATEEFFEVDYKFGQQDLVEFAKYAKDYDYTISANGMDRKYSLLYYNDEEVDFNPEDVDSSLEEREIKFQVDAVEEWTDVDDELDPVKQQ